MTFNKFFYGQFKKSIEKEVAKYDAHQEVRPTNFKKCTHKQVKFVDGQLKCSCGASWSGPRLNELYQTLKGGKYAQRKKRR